MFWCNQWYVDINDPGLNPWVQTCKHYIDKLESVTITQYPNWRIKPNLMSVIYKIRYMRNRKVFRTGKYWYSRLGETKEWEKCLRRSLYTKVP